MALHRDFQAGFEQRLRLVTAAGVTLPDEIGVLRERLRAFQDTSGAGVRDRLAQAVIDGDTTDRDLMYAAALAEIAASPPAVADLREVVRVQVNRAIRAAYAEVAVPTYRAIAAEFDKAAEKLHTAAAAVDIELDPAVVIDAPDKQRQAWRSAGSACGDLARLAPSLWAAAVLAGSPDSAEAEVFVMVDPGDAHRREVWAAWEIEQTEAKAARAAASGSIFTTNTVTRSRCGRWGALVRTGATIRACPPDQFTEYRKPRPMVEQVRDGKRVMVDPESPDYREPEPPKFKPPLTRAGT